MPVELEALQHFEGMYVKSGATSICHSSGVEPADLCDDCRPA
jgi:hypothetical protein